MTSSQYIAQYPTDLAFDPAFKRFIENFYQVSDKAGSVEEWVDMYTKDALVLIGNKKAVGEQEITDLRRGSNAEDVMLRGTVDFTLKDGRAVEELPWAARARLVKDGDAVKMCEYQVYSDSHSATK